MKEQLAASLRAALRHADVAVSRLRARAGNVALATGCTALALALPMVLILLIGNLGELVTSWRSDYTLSVYLAPQLDDEDGTELAEQWRELESVADITVITREQAAQAFGEATGAGDLITAIGENPLPVVIQIWPSTQHADPTSVRALAARLEKTEGVDEIDLDITWLERADAALDTLTRIATLVACLLVSIAVALIGTSVRQQLTSLSDEIALSKLVGASDSTLRIPFLISGGLIGLLAGILALVVTAVAQTALAEPVAALAASYQSDFQLSAISPGLGIALVSAAIAIGIVGAALAIELRLRHIQPD